MKTPIRKVCLLLLGSVISSSVVAAEPAGLAKPVVIDIARLRVLAPTAQYSGSVISKNDARLAAEVAGRLTWVADVGTLADKGDVVARLDTVFLQQQRSEELATIQSEQARLNLYTKEVKRYQRLIEQNNVAESRLDQAISDRLVTANNIAAARARLTQIEERMARSDIRAPFGGVVTERFAQAGEWSQNGMALIRLVDIDNSEIQVRVPQHIYPLIKIASDLEIITDHHTIRAKVQTIVPVGTTASRLFELRLAPEQTLPPGSLVRVAVPIAKARQVMSIHRDALVIRKNGISVFRVNGENITEQLPVEVGSGDNDYVEIIGSIQTGDRIIIRGGERLRAGQRVKLSHEQSN